MRARSVWVRSGRSLLLDLAVLAMRLRPFFLSTMCAPRPRSPAGGGPIGFGPPVKVVLCQPELFDRIPCSQQRAPDTFRDGKLVAVPAYVFACYPDARRFAIEAVQRIQMLKNNITQLPRRQCIGLLLALEQGVDITKNP